MGYNSVGDNMGISSFV